MKIELKVKAGKVSGKGRKCRIAFEQDRSGALRMVPGKACSRKDVRAAEKAARTGIILPDGD